MSSNYKTIFNPYTGELQLVSNPDTAQQAFQVVIEADCEASAALYNVVYQSETTDDKVEVNANNTETQPSIGVIIEKISDTRCKVLLLGELDGFTGLDRGKKIWVGTDGAITTTPPTTGYQQPMGFARSTTKVLINPDYRRVFRS